MEKINLNISNLYNCKDDVSSYNKNFLSQRCESNVEMDSKKFSTSSEDVAR
jgi:hypothetical protein